MLAASFRSLATRDFDDLLLVFCCLLVRSIYFHQLSYEWLVLRDTIHCPDSFIVTTGDNINYSPEAHQ
jgi:hypothetical protein